MLSPSLSVPESVRWVRVGRDTPRTTCSRLFAAQSKSTAQSLFCMIFSSLYFVQFILFTLFRRRCTIFNLKWRSTVSPFYGPAKVLLTRFQSTCFNHLLCLCHTYLTKWNEVLVLLDLLSHRCVSNWALMLEFESIGKITCTLFVWWCGVQYWGQQCCRKEYEVFGSISFHFHLLFALWLHSAAGGDFIESVRSRTITHEKSWCSKLQEKVELLLSAVKPLEVLPLSLLNIREHHSV